MKFATELLPVVGLLAPCVLAAPALLQRQDNHTLNRQRADAVKQTFQIAWDGYYKYAFPNDELHPVSNSFGNPR